MSGSSVERSKPRIGYGLCRLAAVRRGSIVRITIYGVLAGIFASLVAVLVPWLPTSASEQMDRIEFTFWFTTVICIAVFSVVAAVILYSILNFRVQPDDELGRAARSTGTPGSRSSGRRSRRSSSPRSRSSAPSCWRRTTTPARTRSGSPSPPSSSRGGSPTRARRSSPPGQLVLPVNETVKLTLRSLDVIHSFWVPEFGQKSDAVPGIETTLVITPNRKGEFPIICTELCGLGHATMRSGVRVVDRRRVRVSSSPARRTGARRRPAKPSSRAPAAVAATSSSLPGRMHEVGPSLNRSIPAASRSRSSCASRSSTRMQRSHRGINRA